MTTEPTADDAVELPVIRQSMRCFYQSLGGLVPFAGISLALHALRGFAQVCEASLERSRRDFPIALLILAFLSNPFFFFGLRWPAGVLFFLTLGAIHCVWMRMEFARARFRRWNPARHFAWAGAALAHLGLALSLLIVETIYLGVLENILLGVS